MDLSFSLNLCYCKTFYINIKTLFQSSFIFTIYYSFFMENRMHLKLHECILCLFQQFINRQKGWWRKKMIIWNQIKYKKVIGWWIINIGIAYTPTSIFFSLPFVFFFLLLLFFCFVYVIVAIICIQALLRVILCGSWKITCSTMVKSNLLMRANLCIICEYYNTDEFAYNRMP